MIRCPICNARAKVLDARTTYTSIRRCRACTECNFRWTTWELNQDLGALLERMTKEFEPTRRRLRYLEEELLLLGKLLDDVATATKGKGPKAPLRYAINRVASRKARPWDNNELKILDLMYPDHGAAFVAEKLGRSITAVQQQAHTRKVKRNASTHKAEDLQEHKQGREEGYTAEASGSNSTQQSKHG